MSASVPDRDWLLSELRRALARLAAPAEEQLASLDELGEGASVDELALDLDDVAGAAVGAEGLLSPEQQRLLDEVVRHLTKMSDATNQDLWTEAALGRAEEWDHLRERAERASAAFRSPP